MKLKKIASLALAGVMAVSMLAGCANKGTTDDSASSTPTVPATGISAKVDALLTEKDKIELTDNATYQAYLSAAIKEAEPKATTLVAVKTATWASSDDVLTELQDTFTKNVVGYSKSSQAISDFVAPTGSSEKVYMSVFTAPGDYTEDVVLSKLATALDAKLTKDALPSVVGSAAPYYSEKYTGSVSMQKVSDGSAASAWYVLVVVQNEATKL